MVMALIVLLGFGALFMFAMDEGAQGADLSIEAIIKRQDKEIDTLKSNLESATEDLSHAPERETVAKTLASTARENQSREVEIEDLRSGLETANEGIARLVTEFEDYKDEYRAFARKEAEGEKLPELTTNDGATYKNVTIREVTAVGMQVRHQAGFKRIPFELLPDDLQDRFQFDPTQKDEAIAEEHARRLEHEKAVAKTHEGLAQQRAAELQEKQRQAEVAKRQRVSQLRNGILALDRQMDDLNRDISAEAGKSISRAPQMRARLNGLRNKQAAMRSELSRLEAEM